MGRRWRSLLRNTVFRGKGSLVSLDEPYDAIARLLKGRSVSGILDAGASNGRISRKLLKLFPQANVFGFEPHPTYRETLERLARAEPRFRPQFCALSDRAGRLTLHLTQSPGSTSLFTPTGRMHELSRKQSVVTRDIEVESVRLDPWRREHGNPAIELMKFDIQGAEAAALRGAEETLRGQTLLVYTEVLFNPLYEGGAIYSEIDLLLRESGFTLFGLYKPRADGRGALAWGNAIFLHASRMGV